HLLNFAHGELITVGAYVTYFCFTRGVPWYWIAPILVVTGVVTSLVIEQLAIDKSAPSKRRSSGD
ncbi:MAG: branched-chain amino acid ABC transporter permease, partial [Rhodobacteraceae bacterium]|nr:branched-chain amino acid ABC transporter permease [Paracoccaceae bacterium]